MLHNVTETYDEAIKKLKILEYKSHAFSTDCDEHAKERAVQVKKNYEIKKMIEKPSKVKELLNVPQLENSDEESVGRYSSCMLYFN